MKFIYFGSPRFAEIILERLLRENLPPAALVCNPDRPVGRKKIVTPPPTKQLFLRGAESARKSAGPQHTLVLQPENLDEAFVRELGAQKPDLCVVAAYAKIIPEAVLYIPRLGTLGVHPSLLPRYRGAAPIQSAILNGEKETGVTLYLMDEKMDHGPVVAAAPIVFNPLTTTHHELEEMLATLGAELLVKTIPDFAAGKAESKPQDESRATYTRKFSAEDGFVPEEDLRAAERGSTEDDKEKAATIVRKINALGEEPGVWTTEAAKHNKRLKLLKAEMRNGALRILRAQEEGGKPKATA